MLDSKKIIEKIKKENIKPTPKWHFLLKNYFIWAAFIISILLGSISFSVLFYILTDTSWDIYKYLNNGFGSFLLLSIPYFWIIFLIIFIFLIYYNYKNTKNGYKYASYLIVIISVIISFISGGTLFALGLGEKIDQTLSNNIPYYQQKITENKIKKWNQPQIGLLIGIIKKINNKNEIIIEDLKGKEWIIKLPQEISKDILEKELGQEIKIVGKKIDEQTFMAKIIKKCRRNCRMKRNYRNKNHLKKMKENNY